MNEYIVRWRGYPLYFHTQPCGRVYSAKTKPANATRFPSIEAAWTKAQAYNLRWAEITIEPLQS